MSVPDRVEIHYARLPEGLRVYDQRVVMARDDVIVTLSQPMDLDEPMIRDGRVMLERESLALWFTFPDVWHDIGLFHRADGSFTGLYANILTPPVIVGSVWHTTDLCLDVWRPPNGPAVLLDEDEFDDAVAGGHIDPDTAVRAREEADRLMEMARLGTWPPTVVGEWSLARALELLGNAPATIPGDM